MFATPPSALKGLKPANRRRSSLAKYSTITVNVAALTAILLMASGVVTRSSSAQAAEQPAIVHGNGRREALATEQNFEDTQNAMSVSSTGGDTAAIGTARHPEVQAALDKLGNCQSFQCVQEVHKAIAGRTRFNFPHYFLVGWQKCATSSVNSYLRYHPQYLPGVLKEPHWFSQCKADPFSKNCHADNETQYMQEYLRLKDAAAGGLEGVTVDASVDYARKGEPLAQDLHDLFPWLKIVFIMREPISRMISYARMYTGRGHARKGCPEGEQLFNCLMPVFEAGQGHYDFALEGWLKVFPAKQLHVIQFEDLQEDPNRVMKELKVFLGMDPQLPEIVLKNVNNQNKAGGYPMTRKQYEDMLSVVRPRAENAAKLLGDNGLADEKTWIGKWSTVWDRVLSQACDDKGQCLVNSN